MYTPRPKGYFERILAFDTETSGLFIGEKSPVSNDGEYYQVVSWGIIVLDAQTLETIEELYIEQQWDGKSIWSDKAEQVHGLSREYLKVNGVTREDAMTQIASLIFKHWGSTPVVTLGHNSITFDLPFIKHEAELADIDLRFGNRHLDSNTLGFTILNCFNSDDMFTELGFKQRAEHNALDDIRMTVKAFKISRKLAGVV